MKDQLFDAVIVGGSFAGLSAAMSLGRSLRSVLLIDNGKPCNRQTPHSHNFITHDGDVPAHIAAQAKHEVLAYPTVQWADDLVTEVKGRNHDFTVLTASTASYRAKKIIFATGLKDLMPDLKGFSECWGISALHCPYCHGYEVRQTQLGILANGDNAFEFGKLISQWTKTLTVFTNGASTLDTAQRATLEGRHITIVEKEIAELVHEKGYIRHLLFQDGSKQEVTAIFSRIPFTHHTDAAFRLGCEQTEMGHLKVDAMQRTNIAGVYAAGDCTHPMRSLAVATSAGSFAGAALNKELIEDSFQK